MTTIDVHDHDLDDEWNIPGNFLFQSLARSLTKNETAEIYKTESFRNLKASRIAIFAFAALVPQGFPFWGENNEFVVMFRL